MGVKHWCTDPGPLQPRGLVHAANWDAKPIGHPTHTLCGKQIRRVRNWVRTNGLRLEWINCTGCRAGVLEQVLLEPRT